MEPFPTMVEVPLFDFADFEPEVRVFSGPAPLGFTAAYFHPDDLIAASDEVYRLRTPWHKHLPATAGAWRSSYMTPWFPAPEGHSFAMLFADLRCHCRSHLNAIEREKLPPCLCVGYWLDQVICAECAWHEIAADDEHAAVAAWHDHAWPGWRDLPSVPLEVRASKKAQAEWVTEHYPREWQVPAAPIVTQRTRPGTRDVPGYSPWGGFDLWDRQAVAA